MGFVGKRYFFNVISIIVKIIMLSVSYLIFDSVFLFSFVFSKIVIIGLM